MLNLKAWTGLIAVFALTYCAFGTAAETVSVRAMRLAELAVHPEHTATATVVSNNDSIISAEVAARVIEFSPRVGDVIEAGGVLARLDCQDYSLALRSASAARDVVRARLALAEQRLARAETLRERNSLAVETLDERRAERAVNHAELASAATRIAQARLLVERCVVKSPFRAVLRERIAPLGQFAIVGAPVARLIDLEQLELSAQLQLDDLTTVMQAAGLEFLAAGQRYPVAVRTALLVIDPQTRNRELRLDFVAKRPLSGAAGQLVWRDPRAHVPGKYIVGRAGTLGVFVVREGRAEFVALPRAQAGRACPVDLPDSALVVTEGQFGLRDQQAVRLLKR